jgi:hypothetical protein
MSMVSFVWRVGLITGYLGRVRGVKLDCFGAVVEAGLSLIWKPIKRGPSLKKWGQNGDKTPKTKKGYKLFACNPLFLLVAGAGFEPATFGL